MPGRDTPLHIVPLFGVCLLLAGCPSPYELRHQNQWDSRTQISVAPASQVKLRAAQSRVFDTTDQRRVIEGIVSTMQDFDVNVDVVDEDLGVVSGRFLLPLEGRWALSSNVYDSDSLLLFAKTYRTWGPFMQRSDTVRLTVTVRKRNEKQLVVRANAQFYLQGVEDPAIYRQFFRALEQSMFLQAHEL